jgi:sulfoxide reductase heme-binding subunit YedZ
MTLGVWVLGLLPLALLVYDGWTNNLTAEPIKEITLRTGWWALTLLLATLAVTPLRRLSGWNPLIQLRKPLGLFAFFYASLHVLTYFGLDQLFELRYLLEDVLERPYITVGFVAWLLLVPLAVTSTKGWIRRLGRRWQVLHRLIYPAAGLAVLHFFWSVKADILEPLVFAVILAVLLGFRFLWRNRSRSAMNRTPPRAMPDTLGEKQG